MQKLTTLCAITLALALSALPVQATQANSLVKVLEVTILSIQFSGSSEATVVVSRCDPSVVCDKMIARVDSNTEILNNGERITLKQARKLQWDGGLISIDKHGNASLLHRYGDSE